MSKKVAVILHPNFEEGEGVVTIDVLRRAGIIVDTYAVNDKLEVTGSHNIIVKADKEFKELDESLYDGIIIPGGSGCADLFENKALHSVLQKFNEFKKMVAGVCGAPQVLGAAGVIKDKKIVKHPTSHSFIDPKQVQTANTFVDGNVVTGVSIGTTIPFALKIVEYLLGSEKSEQTRQELVIF